MKRLSFFKSRAPEGSGAEGGAEEAGRKRDRKNSGERKNVQQPAPGTPEAAAICNPHVFTDVTSDPFVRGLLHQPENPNGSGVILTHGAGSNCQAPLLVALAERFCDAGFVVLRCDLPFRQDRPYGPPGPGDATRDRRGISNAIASFGKMARGRIFLGGHSYGGRQSSILCAEDKDAQRSVAGLLLLAYPLHPPQKPAQLRTQHFTSLQTPALFVEGTRDSFATIAEIEQALKMIPGKTRLMTVEGAGHDLGFKGKARNSGLTGAVLASFGEFFGG